MIVKYVGLTAPTAALIENFRETPSELEDAIIQRVLWARMPKPIKKQMGCDLGDGVVLAQDEPVECYILTRGKDSRPPDGVAIARDGALYIGDQRVAPRRNGAWLQAALVVIQTKLGHISPTTGELVSLDAWEHWFANRDGKRVRLSDLRSNVRRRRRSTQRIDATLEELGL